MSESPGAKRGGIKLSKSSNKHSKEEERPEKENMAIPDILINIATALDRVEAYIDGDTSFNPKNTLNGIRISLTTARGLMQKHAQDAINMQDLYHIANDRINGLRNDLTTTRNQCLRRAQLLTLAYNNKLINQRCKAKADLAKFNRAFVFNRYQKWKGRELNSRQIILNLQNNPPGNMATIQDVMHTLASLLAQLPNYDGQEPPDVYYQKLKNINEMARLLAVTVFNSAVKCQVMINKMTGRFAPVLVNDPYAAETDTPDSYEKRIKPLVQAMPDADALPYLFNQLPSDLEMRVRIANPATVIAFFTDLRNIWHESAGKRIQAHTIAPVNYTAQPQKDDFKIHLARDLAYSGIVTDDTTLENFIYEELQKRLGSKTTHVRKSPFTPRSAYATKKVVRKVVQKAKQTRNCSACGKADHTKVNCPKGKQTKKVNHVYQDEVEDPENSEEEYIEEYIKDSKEEEVGEDDEYIDADESRNCYAVKKSGTKWSTYEKKRQTKRRSNQEIPYFQISEILIEISKFINTIFPKLKDHCLNTVMPNDTVKRRELAWENVTSKVQDILFPLLQAVNTEQNSLLDVLSEENAKSSINTMGGIIVNNSKNNQETAPSHILNHAIKVYAQSRSAEKKVT
ncbi:hypothetical protein RclHR1_09450008 [Rhizophagus clarus]|uniref:Uncharacterized protein n=1 Tax=Rhizophagus clarus TaxID=94130 RepID=A0A2Z6S4G1_9GLOM|nr:hypothetical protein RclHR1_09450008 [Rhizophagus clarus]